MTVAGVSTLGVALLPLQREPGGTGDLLHAVAAGTGYLAMACSPALGARGLARLGRPGPAAASAVVSAVSVAALTVVDMVKAVDKAAVITDVRVETKTGGKSGDWERP